MFSLLEVKQCKSAYPIRLASGFMSNYAIVISCFCAMWDCSAINGRYLKIVIINHRLYFYIIVLQFYTGQ